MAILTGRARLWTLAAGSRVWAKSLVARGPLTDMPNTYWTHTVYPAPSKVLHVSTSHFSLHQHSWGRYDNHPIYSWGNRDSENLSDLPKLTQLIKAELGFKSNSVGLQCPCSFHSSNWHLSTYSMWASPVAQMVKNLPAMQETMVWSLGQEDPLE